MSLQQKRPRDEYSLHVFDLHDTSGWSSLMHLNGGESAPWLTAAQGKAHSTHMCCLVLDEEPHGCKSWVNNLIPHFQEEEEQMWVPYATRIAIVVPVAVQSGIALVQGIKRLDQTCPCEHLKQLGMALLTHVVQHFGVDFLFMSPIGFFKDHVQQQLSARQVPFGRLGKRSLWWAVEEDGDHFSSADKWLTIRHGELKYTGKDRFLNQEVFFLIIINPQSTASRTLLLNAAHYVPRGGHCDPDYESPPEVELETHDFLWFLAGDGVLVVHGPSLARML